MKHKNPYELIQLQKSLYSEREKRWESSRVGMQDKESGKWKVDRKKVGRVLFESPATTYRKSSGQINFKVLFGASYNINQI